MRLIDTSGITTSKGYPLLANNPNAVVGLDFLQAGLKEIFAKLAQSVSLSGNPTILEGMALSGNNISAGGVYSPAGEIFIYDGGNISGTPTAWIACFIVPTPTDTGSSQTVLSDGSQVSIHNLRLLEFAYASGPNTGDLNDYGTWVQAQPAINAAAIAALQQTAYVPYRAFDRVTSGTIPSTETVLHAITVPYTINNLLVMVNMELANITSQQAVSVKVYVGGTVSGHTPGSISGTVSGGTIVKQGGQDTDPAYNNTVNLSVISLTNITAGQSVTVTILGGSGGSPVLENSSDLVLDGSYLS